MVRRAATNNGTKMFCHHINLFTNIYVKVRHYVQVQASGGTILQFFSVTFYLWASSVPLVLQTDNGLTVKVV